MEKEGESSAIALQVAWMIWRSERPWPMTPLDLAIKVGEEAGEVMGAVLKFDRQDEAQTHPEHDRERIRHEIGQLQGVLFCLAEFYDIDPIAEARRELDDVRERFGG